MRRYFRQYDKGVFRKTATPVDWGGACYIACYMFLLLHSTTQWKRNCVLWTLWKICLSFSDGCDTITQSCVFFLLRNHKETCGKSKFHKVSARCDLSWRRHETTDVESHHAVVFWALARELKAADGRKVISAEIVPDEEQLVATFPSAAASAATY